MELSFFQERYSDIFEVLGCEWLETNDCGGYASSTIADCHTRRYHGWLVAPLASPPGRYVFLSKIDAELVLGQRTVPLSMNKFPGVYHPNGHKLIERFTQELLPTTVWREANVALQRSLMMPRGEQAILARYELLETPGPIGLRLRPIFACRDFHALTEENPALRPELVPAADGWRFDPYHGLPGLFVQTNMPVEFTANPFWLKNVEYEEEQRRDLPCREDLFCPGRFEATLDLGQPLLLRVGLDAGSCPLATRWSTELRRRQRLDAQDADDIPEVHVLKQRGADFLITNEAGDRSIVAGYPWFGQWGRDAMISLPGLTFCCDRAADGWAVLATFARHEKHGLVPNYLNIAAEPAYNSVDASLWFIWAVQQAVLHTGNYRRAARDFGETVTRILLAFAAGRPAHVRRTPEGLIHAGTAHTQLTWMDAQVNGQPVTPRHGLAVELNALWYNGLCFLNELADAVGTPPPTELVDLRRKVAKSFPVTFWHEEVGYLADVVQRGGADLAIRPNQIFAASLPYSPLDAEQRRSVVAVVTDHLLTPYGLRTLSPVDADYHGACEGSMAQRDAAYHQGTVWPWLIGHYGEARLKLAANRAVEARELRHHLQPLRDHLSEAGLFSISEIFNGDAPYKPGGCIAQAWSVAEVIRLHQLIKESEAQ